MYVTLGCGCGAIPLTTISPCKMSTIGNRQLWILLVSGEFYIGVCRVRRRRHGAPMLHLPEHLWSEMVAKRGAVAHLSIGTLGRRVQVARRGTVSTAHGAASAIGGRSGRMLRICGFNSIAEERLWHSNLSYFAP